MMNNGRMSLEKKEKESLKIIEKAFTQFGNDQAVAFTGGKDSLCVLHLVRRFCNGTVPVPVINIDTTVKFPEIYEFRNFIANEWHLNLKIVSNREEAERIDIAKSKADCCRVLKIDVLNRAISDYQLKAIMTGVRWDEQAARAQEEYFSKKEKPSHVRVNPILHFKEADIWHYIEKYNLPYCNLYDEGYRSLGCIPCTVKNASGSERGGRCQEKEEIMGQLRSLGYF
jgi:phosphoadenosine phosphosulfate reductase